MSRIQRVGGALLCGVLFLGVGAEVVSAQSPINTFASRAPRDMFVLLGDVNRDCWVNVDDLLGVLGSFGQPGGDADLNHDGIVDQIDLDIVQAVWGSTCGRRLIGDVDGNGIVEFADLSSVLGNFGTTNPRQDFNADGIVDQIDLDLLLANWGRILGTRLLGDVNGNDVVNIDDLTFILVAFTNQDPRADLTEDGVVDEMDLDVVQAVFGATSASRLLGDVNGDCVVNDTDLDLIEATWGTSWPQTDIDGNGDVNVDDLLTVISNFGRTCGADRLLGDINGDCLVDQVDLDLLLAVWGTDYAQADVDKNGTINTTDLVTVLGNFGSICGTSLLGDINGDCVVDQVDLDLVQAVFGSSWPQADLDGNGAVEFADLSTVLGNFGETCP